MRAPKLFSIPASAPFLPTLIAALVEGRLVEGFLYGVRPGDPATIGVILALVLLVALAAGAIPAWRAARMDPLAALRED